MKIPQIVTSRSITFYVAGEPYSIDRLIELTLPATILMAAVGAAEEADYLPRGTVSVTRSSVSYNGEPIHGVLVDRIFDMLAEGFDIMPMVRFLENLMMNPTLFAREELYLWLESSDLPITDDGHFLAYKRVNDDFTSVHDGKTDNTPGTIVSMPRHAVDKDRNNTCSSGLHFCSKSYLPSFAPGRTVVLVKINPADVVSIPSDYDNAKGRAWQYEVIEQVAFDIPTHEWAAIYSDDSDTEDEDDFGYDEEEEEDWEFDSLSDEDTVDDINELFGSVPEASLFEDDAYDISLSAEATDNHIESIMALLGLSSKVEEEEEEESWEDTVNGYGIIQLRRVASLAGFKGAWKGAKAAELRAFLLSMTPLDDASVTS
jgi:hypothetical protein